jgi:hypothetical protein
MKTISARLKREIEDASAEGLIALPPEIIEKDIHVTDALKAVAETIVTKKFFLSNAKKNDPRGRQIDVGSTLVFAGGTCLSKAHGLIERMSEDIDIKVILDDVPTDYKCKNGSSERARLKDLHAELYETLRKMGFVTANDIEPSGRGTDNPWISDARRHFHLRLNYQPVFPQTSAALRPQIKLELIHRHTTLASDVMTIGYLFDRLLNRQSDVSVSLACISIPETLAEKVLSMLRRCAWKWYGGQDNDIDSTLVRHIYDVCQIMSRQPAALSAAAKIFPLLVTKDVEEFGMQYPEFGTNARNILLKSLERLATDEEQTDNYNEKLIPLIYARDVPEYPETYAVFRKVAETLIGMLPPDPR